MIDLVRLLGDSLLVLVFVFLRFWGEGLDRGDFRGEGLDLGAFWGEDLDLGEATDLGFFTSSSVAVFLAFFFDAAVFFWRCLWPFYWRSWN